MYDDNCVAIFTTRSLPVHKHVAVVLTGKHNWVDSLWDVHFNAPPTQSLNIIIIKDKAKRELAKYFHKCAFSPALTTLQKAVRKGHFITWPGIEEIKFEKNIINTLPTAKGHLDQERANLQSTKKSKTDIEDFTPSEGTGNKTYKNSAQIVHIKPKETTYSNQTGCFPYHSSRGNKYVMVMYDYDSNAILAAPLKNRQAKSITDACKTLHAPITKHGHVTRNFILDNECSVDLKQALTKNKK